MDSSVVIVFLLRIFKNEYLKLSMLTLLTFGELALQVLLLSKIGILFMKLEM